MTPSITLSWRSRPARRSISAAVPNKIPGMSVDKSLVFGLYSPFAQEQTRVRYGISKINTTDFYEEAKYLRDFIKESNWAK